MVKLYRGVSKKFDKKANGKICPKGENNEISMHYNDHERLRYDGKFQYGESENNVARAHQIKSGMHGGSGISTSRNYEVAKEFALSNQQDGFIYVINGEKKVLQEYKISQYEFYDAEYKNQEEVTLVTENGACLPEILILDKIEVKGD